MTDDLDDLKARIPAGEAAIVTRGGQTDLVLVAEGLSPQSSDITLYLAACLARVVDDPARLLREAFWMRQNLERIQKDMDGGAGDPH
jgi:hypothetical protein